MKELKQLAANIKYLNDNWNVIIDNFIRSFEPDFVDIVQSQLIKGEDGNAQKLDEYRSQTNATFKKSIGSVSSPYADLKLEGDFYDGMFMNKFYEIRSRDWKEAKLVDKYGDAILDPSENNLTEFLNNQMIPEFYALIDKLLMKNL
jgi:hypothetical protein